MRTKQARPTRKRNFLLVSIGLILLGLSVSPRNGFLARPVEAQEETASPLQIEGAEPLECSYFTNFSQHSSRGPAILERWLSPGAALQSNRAGLRTQAVTGMLGSVSDGPSIEEAEGRSWIDDYIFSALDAQGIAPARLANDAAFLRRVTLDLTGRIPPAETVVEFLSDDEDSLKRARAIDRLLDSPEWVDRWTFWFGDLLKNNSRSTQVVRRERGRDEFNRFIRESLEENKPYDTFVRELITAAGDSYENGAVNFNVGGRMTMGPAQDTYDKQWVQAATVFLGLKNFDCVLCHNGAGHLDAVNLWASQVTRYEAWGMAAFFSRTRLSVIRRDQAADNSYLIQEAVRGGYDLNTNSGNRPPRRPAEGEAGRVQPRYLFSGRTADAAADYRAVLAQEVTSDFQFARATVNYIWAHFFTIGLVDPPDAFDLARLDPYNPPPEPWTLQPSHPELLDELARFFIAQQYDLKALMREITNSRSYQLSARYEGEWSPAYERLLARRLVRRMDSEELHDALVQSSGIPGNLRLRGSPEPIPWAMQLPETATPGGAVGAFLNTFLRGDRDENPRRGDLSVAQALDLMNDPVVLQRVRASNANGLLARLLGSGISDQQLVDALYLSVLSRYPTADERDTSVTLLQTGNRRARAEDLLWSLYNKVDFLFHY